MKNGYVILSTFIKECQIFNDQDKKEMIDGEEFNYNAAKKEKKENDNKRETGDSEKTELKEHSFKSFSLSKKVIKKSGEPELKHIEAKLQKDGATKHISKLFVGGEEI